MMNDWQIVAINKINAKRAKNFKSIWQIGRASCRERVL